MIAFESLFKDETRLGTKIKTDDYLEHGRHPIIDQGQNEVAGYTNLEDGIYSDVPAVIFGDHTRVIKYIDEPFFLGADGTKILKGYKPHSNQKYLYYALRAAKIPNLGYSRHFKCLKELKFVEHSEDEQQQIVAELDKLSEIISLKMKELLLYDELVKARFVEMFSNETRWTKSTIGECCKLKSGMSLSSSKENEGGSIPYVKVGDMNLPGNEKYITTSSRFVTEATANKGLFEIGSTIFPKRGGAIGTNKKRMTKAPICADLNVMGVSSKGQLLPEYLFAYFEMIDLASLSDGSSVPQINNKNIAPLEVFIPPIVLQTQFAAFVAQVDKSKFALGNELAMGSFYIRLIYDRIMHGRIDL